MKPKSKAMIIHHCPQCGKPYPGSRKRCYQCHPGGKAAAKASPALLKALDTIATFEPAPTYTVNTIPVNGHPEPDEDASAIDRAEAIHAAALALGDLLVNKVVQTDLAALKTEVADLRATASDLAGKVAALTAGLGAFWTIVAKATGGDQCS